MLTESEVLDALHGALTDDGRQTTDKSPCHELY